MTSDPRMDKEFILIDQIKPIKLCREIATAKKYTSRCVILEFLNTFSKIASNVMAICPNVVLSR